VVGNLTRQDDIWISIAGFNTGLGKPHLRRGQRFVARNANLVLAAARPGDVVGILHSHEGNLGQTRRIPWEVEGGFFLFWFPYLLVSAAATALGFRSMTVK